MLVEKYRVRAPGDGVAEDEDADEQHKDKPEEVSEGRRFSARLIGSEGQAHALAPFEMIAPGGVCPVRAFPNLHPETRE